MKDPGAFLEDVSLVTKKQINKSFSVQGMTNGAERSGAGTPTYDLLRLEHWKLATKWQECPEI